MQRLKKENGNLLILGSRTDDFIKITMEFLRNRSINYEKILYISLISPREDFEKQYEEVYGFDQVLYKKITFVSHSMSFDDLKCEIENSDEDFVVINYLQLIQFTKGVRVIEELKNLSKKTKKVIIGYTYVNRHVEKVEGKIAKLSDFRHEDINCADGIFYMYDRNDIRTIKKVNYD